MILFCSLGFFCALFVWFWYQGNICLIKWVGKCSNLFSFSGADYVELVLICLWIFSRILQWNHLGQDIFFFGCFKISDSVSLIDNRIFRSPTSCRVSCIRLRFERIGPSHQSCQMSVCAVACGILLSNIDCLQVLYWLSPLHSWYW